MRLISQSFTISSRDNFAREPYGYCREVYVGHFSFKARAVLRLSTKIRECFPQ